MTEELRVTQKILNILEKVPDKQTRAWILGFVSHKAGCVDQAKEVAKNLAAGSEA